MANPVDLTNLREMTDGDADMEQALFQEFYSSGDRGIQVLETNCLEGANENWRSAAHALKGMAYNLGAKALGDWCKKAQDQHSAGKEEKQTILEGVRSEYQLVKQFLKGIHQ